MDLGVKIAIENHKDLQAWETRQVIESAGKEFVGSYLDTGNPSFVLEHPLTTLEELGPYAVCVHLRDSVVYETPRGVAVQWVPLGEGTVDFREFIARMQTICPPVYVYIKPITGGRRRSCRIWSRPIGSGIRIPGPRTCRAFWRWRRRAGRMTANGH